MLDNYQFNAKQFDATIQILSNVIDGNIVYGNYVLHDSTDVYVSTIDADNMGMVDMDIFNNPLGDGQTLTNYYLRGRSVKIRGTIIKSNAEDFNNELDTMKSHLSKPGKMLSIKVNGEVRQSIAYCSGLVFDRQHYNINFVQFTASFTITSEARETVSYQISSTLGVTTTLLDEVINYGKYKAKPIIIMTINSQSGLNSIGVRFGSNVVTIARTFSVNDIIEINRERQLITVNTLPVDYTGMIPTLEEGRNSFTITPNGTYSYDLTIKYKKRFI